MVFFVCALTAAIDVDMRGYMMGGIYLWFSSRLHPSLYLISVWLFSCIPGNERIETANSNFKENLQRNSVWLSRWIVVVFKWLFMNCFQTMQWQDCLYRSPFGIRFLPWRWARVCSCWKRVCLAVRVDCLSDSRYCIVCSSRGLFAGVSGPHFPKK